MANRKWTKWAVGLSGVALYSLFVGYISGENTDTAQAATVAGSYDSSASSDQDQLRRQWQNEAGGSVGTGEQGGTGSNSGSSSGGRLRTRGS
ncbi:hypothetical protein [Cohnella fermenti]|uniref:Uncharacterized protein n=1 Tax=Cohnella fermenti TaxID=2565925 RepID=A0A4V3WFH1_9BACL|nr:hypothetical protein [Cohnella fermenti]THF79905.1 hypothetical protein E6C55_11270 [Cohnella fermenti]